MGRAPCCEKMGLKKGPWTPEEDQILINYINQFGHGNWRALPKQAGLLRCGKSCRLRWTNYLRPDIKRGNFTQEEEDTIINLHEMLGNRWSAIAARLPGRTDNEIKNVWHTHLKKRLKQYNNGGSTSNENNPKKRQKTATTVAEAAAAKGNDSSKDKNKNNIKKEQDPVNCPNSPAVSSPQESLSSEVSTVTTTSENHSSSNNSNMMSTKMETQIEDEEFSEIDENFWSEVLSADNSSEFQVVASSDQLQAQTDHDYFPSSPLAAATLEPVNNDFGSNILFDNDDTNMDFWYNLFTRAGDLPELPQL
ncbi:hypothetical protein CCACVL1_02568 [Corchorus capsularis]|uniref:Uncharacterized protein n=1 Tax=Corchorus capsularis TaxID=210143 RepID=A0A1R3K7M8_COCAP|nr:hypothetical protein CCACVL1_02568 [Corchorus capsularis]